MKVDIDVDARHDKRIGRTLCSDNPRQAVTWREAGSWCVFKVAW